MVHTAQGISVVALLLREKDTSSQSMASEQLISVQQHYKAYTNAYCHIKQHHETDDTVNPRSNTMNVLRSPTATQCSIITQIVWQH